MTWPSINDTSEQMLRLAQRLESDHESPVTLLGRLPEYAVDVVPGADHAAITSITQGRVATPAATGPLALAMNDVQRRCNEGPGLSAALGSHFIESDDLEQETRWPAYRAAVVDSTPVRALMAFALFSSTGAQVALTVYAERTRGFDDRAREVGMFFAIHTGHAWDVKRSAEQYGEAIASRDVIGQAKGRMMERHGVDAWQAFELLRKQSQDSNIPLVRIAECLATCEHPPVSSP